MKIRVVYFMMLGGRLKMNVIHRLGAISSNKKYEMEYDILHTPLSDEWLSNMRVETKVLWDLESLHTPWWGAHENYNELKNYLNNYKPEINIWRELHLISDDCQNAMKKITQLVTNSIVSSTAFLTICEVYVKRNFSNDLEVVNKWNEKRNLLHKGSFFYRLSYALRNYSQHYALPVTGAEIIMTGDAVKGMQGFVDTRILKLSGFEWKRFLIDPDFQSDRLINCLDLLGEYLECVDIVYKNTIDLHRSRLKSCSNFFQEIITSLNLNHDKHPVIFKGGYLSSKTPPVEKEYIPVYLYNRLVKDWRVFLNFNSF